MLKVVYAHNKQEEIIVDNPLFAQETEKKLEEMAFSLQSMQTKVNSFLTEKLRLEQGAAEWIDAKETADLETDSDE
jgi:hypothetical protein